MRSLGTTVLLGILLSSACGGSEANLDLGATRQGLANDDRGFVPGNVRGQPSVAVQSRLLLEVAKTDACVEQLDALDARLGAEQARVFPGELSPELADELLRVELEIGEAAPPAGQLLEATRDKLSSTDWAVLGDMNGADIEALSFLVLMQASESAQEDLKAIMAGVKAINSEKAKLREQIAARTGAQRGWVGCARTALDPALYETLPPGDRELFTLSLERLAALLAALDGGMPELERLRSELLDELD